MDVKITPSNLNGTFYAPPSKSQAHRFLICAYLSGEKGIINNIGTSKDVFATVSALKSLGLICKESVKNNGEVVFEKREVINNNPTVNCFESGSTLRFLLPVASALGIKCTFTGTERLLSRPNDKLVQVLNEHNADINGYTLNGKLTNGIFKIDANISSQYITGLLFSLPILDGDSEIILENDVVSKDYITLTLDALQKFGITIVEKDNGFFIKGNQKYKFLNNLSVEGDFSSASFLLTAGAIGGTVTAKNLDYNSKQGDKKIIELLKEFGANVEIKENEITVSKNERNAFNFNAKSTPDLIQIASVLACFASEKCKISGVDRLK
ncbi:MAG TPA: 3-phosphoshikimate 1-carboxyvinyltransferase, partial [Clostridiales bacterium]|nr:3-phosphoshikimate 1-carboxyvinyltransferase [Clostridiales bacterium]